MSKKLKIGLVAGAIAVIMILGIIAMVLLVPRTMKEPVILWNGEESFQLEEIDTMTKTAGKDFKILTITDLQFDNPFKSKDSVRKELRDMVNYAKPDMIVTNGDNFAGIFNHFHVSEFVKLMDELELPWAPIYGNHERDFSADLYYLGKEIMKSKYGMFKYGPTNIDGVGNYVINIEEADKIAYSLFLMDSNEEIWAKDSANRTVYNYYDNVRTSQVEWYEDNVNGITAAAGRVVPSIAFFHVPIEEFNTAMQLRAAGSDEVETVYGTDFYGAEREQYINTKNYGFFDKMVELGSTRHMFSGHIHSSNFSLKYRGMHMTHVNKTGNFSSHIEGKTGGTLITLGDNGAISYAPLIASEI